MVMLAEGTHTIMMEKNRMELFRAVQAFLDEAGGF
jgi:alpha-beta hydrolase superfamily lysophospholipase